MRSSTINCLIFTILAATSAANPTPQIGNEDGAVNADIPPATLWVAQGTFDADGNFIIGVEPDMPEDLPATEDRPATVERRETGDLIELDRRFDPITLSVISITAGAAALKAIQIALQLGVNTIEHLGNWNEARELFTKKTVTEMWNRNPDYEKYPAAICYNKGYNFQHENKWSGRVRAELKLGEFLHTDYDCMYMEGGNQFYTHHEGGYINLAYMYHGRCNHDRRTGDLTCN